MVIDSSSTEVKKVFSLAIQVPMADCLLCTSEISACFMFVTVWHSGYSRTKGNGRHFPKSPNCYKYLPEQIMYGKDSR